ncbi:MAG TPA: PBP1A family penicillin-binding protein [Candidatus Limnocylindrales bacterium]|nr:PBP1A family penicillin-binding protein [Candidatus Limnocylindrales bacterium]
MAEKRVAFDQNKRDKPFKGKKRSRIAGKVFKMLLLTLLLVFLIVGGVAAARVVNYLNDTPSFDVSRLTKDQTSHVYDYHDEKVFSLHYVQNRILVSLDEIPEHVLQAFIAIEDERFHRHFGFDIIASARAAWANFQAGAIVQGGSTITQQLAQNYFLTKEVSYERKVQEIWMALQFERKYSKEEILEMYLNLIYFGNGAYGVETAARTYFDKGIGELSVAEAAMLAAMVRLPNFYNPFNNEEAALSRMRLVLANMYRLGFISEFVYRSALNEEFVYAVPPDPEDLPFPHFINYLVHEELVRILSAIPEIGSIDEAYRLIYTGGLHIYTTLDPALQSHVEELLRRDALYPNTIYINMTKAREMIASLASGRDLTRAELQSLVDPDGGVPQPQAAIVIADPVTGRIKALGGGRRYLKGIDVFPRFTSLRQTGSAIKPIIVYAPAFEEGVLAGASTPLDDSPFTGPRGWQPQNFDLKFRGMIPAREALYISYNVPAVRAFQALGTRLGVRYAERMGISTIHPGEVDNLSLSLGAFTRGVSPLDMAQAYSVLANSGVKVDLHVVRKIVNHDGVLIYENQVNPRQVLSPQSAFIVNDILQDFVRKYLGRNLQIDRPVAAKTGTSENWNDVYLVAYTPNLVVSFWMGYDEPRIGSIRQGWRFSTNFVREVLLRVFQTLEIKNFVRPPGVTRMEVCIESGLVPTDVCRAAGTVRFDYFIEKHVPRVSCDVHALPVPEPEEITDEPVEEQPPETDESEEEQPAGDIPPEDSNGVNEDAPQSGDESPLPWWEVAGSVRQRPNQALLP